MAKISQSGPDDAATLEVSPSFNVSRGLVDPDVDKGFDATLIWPDTSHSWLKLEEARYFLQQLEASRTHQAAALYNTTALLAALNALPEILQKDCQGSPGFSAWFDECKKQLGIDRLKDLKNRRNAAMHHGAAPPEVNLVCKLREDSEGNPTVQFGVRIHLPGGDGVEGLARTVAAWDNVLREAHELGYVHRKPPRVVQGFELEFWKQAGTGEWDQTGPTGLQFTSQLREIGINTQTKYDPRGRGIGRKPLKVRRSTP